jgi:hypothetical protein
MDCIIKILETKKVKNVLTNIWKTVKVEKTSSPEEIIVALKSKKATFKIVEKTVEKTHTFNGNNYVIASKML